MTDPLSRDDDMAVISFKPRDIRLPKDLKKSIAINAVLDLVGKRIRGEVDAALTAQGFK